MNIELKHAMLCEASNPTNTVCFSWYNNDDKVLISSDGFVADRCAWRSIDYARDTWKMLVEEGWKPVDMNAREACP